MSFESAMDTTAGASEANTIGLDAPVVSLTVVHHRGRSFLGRRLVVDGELVLSRVHPSLGARDDKRLSREHARVVADGDGVWVTDLGSRNGTFVDGARITRSRAAEGSVIGVGGLLLLVHRAPAVFAPPRGERVAGWSHALASVLSAARGLAAGGEPFVLSGETGVGKGLVAEEVLNERGLRLVALSAGAVPDERAHAELFGEDSRAGVLESAAGGVLLLDGVDDASPAFQLALLQFLDTRVIRRLGEATARTVDARVVSTARAPLAPLIASGKLRSDFVARLGTVVELAPLRKRREDVIAIARAFLDEAATDVTMDAGLSLALVRHPWPGNVRELQHVLARALLDATGGVLTVTPGLSAMLAGGATADEAPRDAWQGGFAIARNGRWFESKAGGPVSLEARPLLASLLRALVGAHEADPDRTLSVADLLAAGWPGERVLLRAGAARVYVAITSLRKLGLRDVIERTPRGYRVDPRVSLRLV